MPECIAGVDFTVKIYFVHPTIRQKVYMGDYDAVKQLKRDL